MSGVILPDWVKQNEVRASYFMKRTEWEDFDRELKNLDPLLDLVYADTREKSPGILPGYFHIRRKNLKGPDNYIPLCGPNGEYLEPTSAVIQHLRENNLWNADVYKKKLSELAEEEERQLNAGREQRKALMEDVRYHVKGNTNPGVLLSDASWSPKAKARKKAKNKAAKQARKVNR